MHSNWHLIGGTEKCRAWRWSQAENAQCQGSHHHHLNRHQQQQQQQQQQQRVRHLLTTAHRVRRVTCHSLYAAQLFHARPAIDAACVVAYVEQGSRSGRVSVRPPVRLSVPSINSSSGLRLVCCWAPCGRRVPAVDRYVLQSLLLAVYFLGGRQICHETWKCGKFSWFFTLII